MTVRTPRALLATALTAASVLALGACSSASDIEAQARAEEGGRARVVGGWNGHPPGPLRLSLRGVGQGDEGPRPPHRSRARGEPLAGPDC